MIDGVFETILQMLSQENDRSNYTTIRLSCPN